ncbi:hypothetical protein C2G38_2193713 [Gigaspora rosea]|uniref:Uncharacterized protein n=1 Tax=Gigaspora rosea TaxID=44941 RepID=A0A397UXQ0_9GLOM|nr:hypothetical protein C2G38_2193713 [Gigaspora rosea]
MQFALTKKLKKAGHKHKLQRRTNNGFCDGTSSGDFNGKFYDGTNNNDSSMAKLYLEQKKEQKNKHKLVEKKKKSVNRYEKKTTTIEREEATNEIYNGTNDDDSNSTNDDFNHNSSDIPTGIPKKKSVSSMKKNEREEFIRRKKHKAQ